MKQLAQGKSVSLFFLGVLGIGIASYCVSARMHTVRRYTFSFDTQVAHKVREGVVASIQKTPHQHPHNLGRMIHEKFPSIDSAAFHRCAPGVIHCAIKGVKPLVTINQQLVVADSGQLLAKDLFTSRSTQYLYNVTMPKAVGTACMPDTFVTSMQQLMPDFFMGYTVTWVDEQEMWLREKEQPFAIVCNAATLPNERLLSYCEQIKKDVLAAQTEKKGRKQHWAADIRFDHQLILFADKEGVGHG